MKKTLLSVCLFAITGISIAKAQVNVGSTAAPDPSAALQVSSTSKGFRLPQVALTSTTTYLTSGTASNTSIGMQVYNTNAGITAGSTSYPAVGVGVYTWDGNGWVSAVPKSDDVIFMSYNGSAVTATNNVATSQLNLGTVYKDNPVYVSNSGSSITFNVAGTYLIEWQGSFHYNVAESNSGGSFVFNLVRNGSIIISPYNPKPYAPQGAYTSGNVVGSCKSIVTIASGDVITFTGRDYNSANGQGYSLDIVKITRMQ